MDPTILARALAQPAASRAAVLAAAFTGGTTRVTFANFSRANFWRADFWREESK